MASLLPTQYNSTGFSIQRDEIISIQQPKKTDTFYITKGEKSGQSKSFILTEKTDPYLSADKKIRVWINDFPVSMQDETTYVTDEADPNYGVTERWSYSEVSNTITFHAAYGFNDEVSSSIRVEYFRITNTADADSHYEDGILRKLAKDLCLHPYELQSNGDPKEDGSGYSITDQPYNLIYPNMMGGCSDDQGSPVSANNSTHCVELGGTWTESGLPVPIDANGKQLISELTPALNVINNLFVVESEKGTDLLSSVKDVTNSNKTVPPTDGSAPAGLKVKRKPQKWRIRFYYDVQDNYLHVNVGTKYQILDNGKISNTELRDGIKATTMRLPGELCDVFLDTQTQSLKNKSGFFRRQGKNTAEFEGSYPMSYRLTTSDHGTVFYLWDHASVGQDDDFAWFVIQRHVDNRTGRIDLEDGYSPVHCVYSPAKRIRNVGDVRWLQQNVSGLKEPISTIYNSSSSPFEPESQSWIRWDVQDAGRFSGGERNDIFYLAGDNNGDVYDQSKLDTYTFPFEADGSAPSESFYAAKHVASRLGTSTDPYEQANAAADDTVPIVYQYTILGGNYPTDASPDMKEGNFPKIARPDRMTVNVDRIEVERAREEEFYIDGKGTVVWVDDNFNWSGTSRQSFVYDPIEHKIVFRTPLSSGSIVELRLFNYASDSTSLGTYMIQIPEDAELPEYNLNVNTEGKAIYRFIVRERDVFKPWDIHKSATMTQVDSPAIINPMEQMSITPARKFIYTFPSPLVTQRFVYATSELDLISYSSADSSAFSGQALIGAGGNQKYTFDRVWEIDASYDGGTDVLNFRAPYEWHAYHCSVGTCDTNGNITTNVTKEDCNGDWTDDRVVYGWSGHMVDASFASVSDTQVSTNKTACEGAGGYWSEPSRVYQGMMSTLENGNGMRIFMLVRGGPINPDYSDVVVLD